MNLSLRLGAALTGLLGAVITTGSTPAAQAQCLRVGVYADNPTQTLQALSLGANVRISVVSAYLTAGDSVPPALITAVNDADAQLMVTWEPDDGAAGPNQPRFRLSSVSGGRYDSSVRALVTQLEQVRAGSILRPMPEMNTPWYAWSGTVNHNSPREFVRAWKHIRTVVHATPGGARIQMLWAPYAWSSPDSADNAIARYFPGRSQVDLVGADGYNFGPRGNLTWTDPGALFQAAYRQIESFAAKPFWMAETGSTARGGDKAGWILSLSTLRSSSMPRLAGVIWYDVDDPLGNFDLKGPGVLSAFRDLTKEGCS